MNEIVQYIEGICENAGVNILDVELDVPWIGMFDRINNIIFLHTELSTRQRAFVLLHEFAHWLQYNDSTYVPVDQEAHEYDADSRVVQLLIDMGMYCEREEYSRLVEYYRGYRV